MCQGNLAQLVSSLRSTHRRPCDVDVNQLVVAGSVGAREVALGGNVTLDDDGCPWLHLECVPGVIASVIHPKIGIARSCDVESEVTAERINASVELYVVTIEVVATVMVTETAAN